MTMMRVLITIRADTAIPITTPLLDSLPPPSACVDIIIIHMIYNNYCIIPM